MTNENWKSLVGKRCLVRGEAVWDRLLTEVKVAEVSPSGERVKFLFIESGHSQWKGADAFRLVEVLAVCSSQLSLSVMDVSIEALNK